MRKTRSKEKSKQKLQVAIRKLLHPNRVFVKVNCHQALSLIDPQTIGVDLISAQFVYLYKLPIVKMEPMTVATTIKGSKGTIDKTCEVERNCRGYEETRMVYVAHLSGWDMILGNPALQYVRPTISAGTTTITIQPHGIDRFSLRMCRGNQVTDQKSDLLTAANSILA